MKTIKARWRGSTLATRLSSDKRSLKSSASSCRKTEGVMAGGEGRNDESATQGGATVLEQGGSLFKELRGEKSIPREPVENGNSSNSFAMAGASQSSDPEQPLEIHQESEEGVKEISGANFEATSICLRDALHMKNVYELEPRNIRLQEELELTKKQLEESEATIESLRKNLVEKKRELYKSKTNSTYLEEQFRVLEDHTLEVEADRNELQRKLSTMQVEYSQISQSGSYNQNSASPTDVSECFKIFPGLSSFSRRLVKSMPEEKRQEMQRKYESVKFLRDSDFPTLTLTAEFVSILFEGFENESFIDGGYSVYLDPVTRKEEFFKLFKHFRERHMGSGSSSSDGVPKEFHEYYLRSKARVVEIVGMEVSEKEYLEFKKAAHNVWALHLLCFSFDPPASLFRVRPGADFEKLYMESPPNMEVNVDSITKVAFMLTPGVRISRSSPIKSVVYPVIAEVVHRNSKSDVSSTSDGNQSCALK